MSDGMELYRAYLAAIKLSENLLQAHCIREREPLSVPSYVTWAEEKLRECEAHIEDSKRRDVAA